LSLVEISGLHQLTGPEKGALRHQQEYRIRELARRILLIVKEARAQQDSLSLPARNWFGEGRRLTECLLASAANQNQWSADSFHDRY
jgi:hypothetical protein